MPSKLTFQLSLCCLLLVAKLVIIPNNVSAHDEELPIWQYMIYLMGDMTVEQVIINGEVVTWQSISDGQPDLSRNVSLVLQQQLSEILKSMKVPYGNLEILKLKPALVLLTVDDGLPETIIAGEFRFVIDELITGTGNMTGVSEKANAAFEQAVANMTRDGLFDDSFGKGSYVDVNVTLADTIPIKLYTTPAPPDDENLALTITIIVCCVIGGLTVILVTTYAILRYRLMKKVREKAAPGNDFYDSTYVSSTDGGQSKENTQVTNFYYSNTGQNVGPGQYVNEAFAVADHVDLAATVVKAAPSSPPPPEQKIENEDSF